MVLLTLLAACAAPPAPPAPTTVATAAPSLAGTAPPSPLSDSLTDLLATLPAGTVGVSAASADQATSLGTWTTGVAWSTIKVPLSIAALRADAPTAELDVAQAITASDNDAAERLWQLLGEPTTAALRVEQVLDDGGSADTVVQSQRIRPPYSPFGQTLWTQPDMARFAFELPCIPDAAPVLDRMRSIEPGQRWGLAAAGFPAKGGWGPDDRGGYLVRQLAVVPTASGTAGVALAAQPADGSFATGVQILDALAGWVLTHRNELPSGSCTLK